MIYVKSGNLEIQIRTYCPHPDALRLGEMEAEL